MLNGVPRILIVRLSAIGDVVRVLPALHALRDRFPNAQIDWAVEDKAHTVIEGHPELDQCIVFSRPNGKRAGLRAFWRFLKTIRGGRYDIAVDFHGILKSGLITRFSRARERYAFAPPRAREGSHLFANHRVNLTRPHLNRIEENLQLCAALDAHGRTYESPIFIPEAINEEIEAYFQETFDAAQHVVGVHPAVDRPEKQWPASAFIELVDLLKADGRFEVLLTHGPGQGELVRTIHDRCRRKPVIAPETPTLKHYAALISQAALYFGGDTGPMHIAAAMGTPVVAVFGGTDPRQHAPIAEVHRALYKGPENPPRRIALADAHEYLARITPEEAYDACVDVAFGARRRALLAATREERTYIGDEDDDAFRD
jgi:lipopolysaccharide heptosyltransferase I